LRDGKIGALLATDHLLWERVARKLDARPQKASLRSPPEG
jgi:hypothetical protein